MACPALASLSPSHARALTLHAAGGDVSRIAAALDIPPEGVPALLDVAAAKLAAACLRCCAAGCEADAALGTNAPTGPPRPG